MSHWGIDNKSSDYEARHLISNEPDRSRKVTVSHKAQSFFLDAFPYFLTLFSKSITNCLVYFFFPLHRLDPPAHSFLFMSCVSPLSVHLSSSTLCCVVNSTLRFLVSLSTAESLHFHLAKLNMINCLVSPPNASHFLSK